MVVIPADKVAALAEAGVFSAKSSKIIVDVDGDGNIQSVKIEAITYRRKKVDKTPQGML